jgi:epoxyqueuosine reductase
MTLTARIKAEAGRLGFELAGVLPVGASLTHPFYRAWLEQGYAGEMAYLERHAELKADLARLAPGARSAVILAINYNHPTPAPPDSAGLRGRISRYAWGRDYHEVLKEKLAALAAVVEREAPGPVRTWSFVDTAPVMEREFAARAGLGWVGKHSVLLHWGRGSWLFLAELLVDVELEYDAPVPPRRGKPRAIAPAAERASAVASPALPLAPPSLALRESCGSCTACIDACPTDAIVAEKTVDSRRCISYHTIELKGPIPEEFRPHIGEWVFGCDICQDVCPWNRRAPLSPEPAFAGTAERATPSLPALLALDETGFREMFRGTAILRSKRRGLLRNAAIALGNRLRGGGERKAPRGAEFGDGLEALGRCLADAEPLIRGAAAWALGAAGGARARRMLERAAQQEGDDTVREEIARAAARYG